MRQKFWMWLAWQAPHNLVKWCSYRMAAHATQGIYGHCIVPEVTMMDALKRWDEDPQEAERKLDTLNLMKLP
ncbi:hypothetical protein LCGC14_1818080 [marine sediment metagenome]|uniref:Uncharacterized protein n=1 Tax=marine sediment metagenome TaxID=412755 RepID=A0A0F9GJS8_9ZZZZ